MTETTTPTEAPASNTHTLLVEIGIEEIPSNVMASTLKQLLSLTQKALSEVTISFSAPQVYGTARRLILFVPQLAAAQEAKMECVVGPPKQAAFDASGNPTQAATGFAKSQGVSLSEIQVKSAETLGSAAKGKKGDYLVVEKVKKIEATAFLLETMIPDILGKLSFPRSMRWNASGIAFIRPVRSIVAIYNEKIVPFSFAGIQSGNTTSGHHMMSPDAFQVTDFARYQKELAKRFVIIDPDERFRRIESQLKALAKEKGGELKPDKALLWDAAYTVEYPNAICGDFDEAFLEIPKEIIIAAMQEHQGYFPLYQKNTEPDKFEKLLPHFITITNIEAQDMSTIQKGNERVLRARLHDARFYFDQDRKKPFSSYREELKKVIFQEKLGTVFQKVERIKTLSIFIANNMGWNSNKISDLERAANLCKVDLVTGVVREFTSLQGTVGRIYAALDGEKNVIGRAIEGHYLPKQAGGALPETTFGRILSIADKLDTLVGCFVGDLKSSGSEDPYAIRRQALGMILIILSAEKLQSLSLDELIGKAILQYEEQGVEMAENWRTTIQNGVSAFLKIRLDTHLSEEIPSDLRAAILSPRNINNPADLAARAKALFQFSSDPLFKPLMTAFKRAIRILPDGFEGEIDPGLLNEVAEKHLYDALVSLKEKVTPLWPDRKYREILEALETLFEPLNQFFEAVMVMDKDEAIRQNRLSLLSEVQRQFNLFGDFSKIVEGE